MTSAGKEPTAAAELGIRGVGFVGLRTERFEETVALYRDIFGLEIIHEGPGACWFRLGPEAQLHVYGPPEEEHLFFGSGVVVGFLVEDTVEARRQLEAAGIAFLSVTETADGTAWSHFRGPDGNVYEVISRRS
jgi:catechol 2,3-dioxygenase-like lactoylglutathione lyase family enzyme